MPPARLPPMELLASFEAVAGTLSFTRAAAQRALTQSAVSRHVKALEASLQVKLFDRGTRGLVLTPEGRVLLATCRDAMQRLRDTVDGLQGRPRRPCVAITTTPGFAQLWLARRLPGFMAEHPDVDVRVDSTSARRDLADEGFDMAVRYVGTGDRTGLPLFDEQMGEVSSPGWRDRDVRGDAPAVRIHVAHGSEAGAHDDWARWDTLQAATPRPHLQNLTFATYPEAVAAAVAGAGVLLGRLPLVAHELSAGTLVPTRPDWVPTGRRYVLVVDPAARSRADVLALAAWLQTAARPRQEAAGQPATAEAGPLPAASRRRARITPSGTPAGRR